MTSMVAEQAGQRGRFVASARSVLVAVPSNSRQCARAVSLFRLPVCVRSWCCCPLAEGKKRQMVGDLRSGYIRLSGEFEVRVETFRVAGPQLLSRRPRRLLS